MRRFGSRMEINSANIDVLLIANSQTDLHHATFSNLDWYELSAWI